MQKGEKLVTGNIKIPEVNTDINERHALVVVRGQGL